jgi:capsular exopolysaccharide synthesis family protein
MRELTPHSAAASSILLREEPLVTEEFLAEEEPLALREYWRVLVKRRRLIAAVLGCTVLATAIVIFSMTPIYTAETTLLVERKAPRAIDIGGASADAQGPDEYDYYRTQYEILKSPSLCSQVIQEQDLEKNPFFSGEQSQKGLVAGWWSQARAALAALFSTETPNDQNVVEIPPANPEPAENEDALASLLQDISKTGEPAPRVIKRYEGMLEVRPVPRTRLVKIAFNTPDPALSALVTNAHAQAYIRQGVERRNQTDEEARAVLEEKLVELRERLEESEEALNNYRREQNIISFDDSKENTASERLAELNRALTAAEAQRIDLEAKIAPLRQKKYGAMPEIAANAFVQSLKQQRAQLEVQWTQLLSQFRPGYPQLVEIEEQIEKINERIQQEMRQVAETLETSYGAAVAKEHELRGKMEEQKRELLRVKDATVKYAILAREIETNRQLYDSVLQRMKEVGVSAELRESNISVIDEAKPPLAPSKPHKTLSLLLSVIVGLMGGVGAAFVLEYLDRRLHTPEEVERHLRVPNLVIVPDFTRVGTQGAYAPKGASNGQTRMLNGGAKVGGKTTFLNGMNGRAHATRDLILDHHAFSLVSEAYRTLRTAILLSRAEEAPKTILFTSATEGEGKTVTAVNSAVVFAQMGLRVLLIDSDMRRPHCHKVLGMEKGIGLTEFLTGQREVRQVIQPTMVEGLFFLSCGVAPPNPTELLGSRKMRDTLHALRKEFDCIILDSPPVTPVSDPLLLAAIVDGVIVVVNGQLTPRDIVKETCARLHQVRAKILGVVLNQVDMESEGYGRYYGYYSSYHTSVEKRKSDWVIWARRGGLWRTKTEMDEQRE